MKSRSALPDTGLFATGFFPSSTMSGRHWLFLCAIVIHSLIPLLAEVLFCSYILVIAFSGGWRKRLSDRPARFVAIGVLVSIGWFVARVGEPWGLGLHTFSNPYRHPVTVLDYAPYLIFFLFKGLQPVSESEVRSTLWAVAAANLLRIPLAIGQRVLGWTTHWTWDAGGIPLVEITVPPMWRGRVDAGFGNWNILGCSMLMSLVAIGALIAYERRRRSRSSGWRLLATTTLAVVACCYLTILVWTGSRNSWVVFGVLSILFGRFAGVGWRYLMVGLTFAGLLLILSVGDFGKPTEMARSVVPKIVWGRIIGLPEMRPSPLSWRLEVFACAVHMAQEKPWIGWGIGSYAPEAEYRLGHIVNHTHNIFLQLATETGIPFAVFFSILMGAMVLATWRALRALPDSGRKVLFAGPFFIVLTVVLLSQISLAVMHSNLQEMIFWWSFSVSYSLVIDAGVYSKRTERPPRALDGRGGLEDDSTSIDSHRE